MNAITISRCARCGEDHVDLEFHLFEGNPVEGVSDSYDMWAMCPTLDEPILLSIREEDRVGTA